MKRRSLFLTLLSVALSQGALAPLAACSADTTTGARVQLRVDVTSNANAAFTTAEGWSVTLSQARVSLGPQFYYDGYIVADRDRMPTLLQRFTPRQAFAHPGHYAAGSTRGEIRSDTSVDLVKGTSTLGMGTGTTGVVRSGTVSFQSTGNVIVVQGVASKGSEVRAFTATLTAAEVSDTDGRPDIVGCAFTDSEFTGNGTVLLNIDVALWFELVKFERLSSGSSPVDLEGVTKNEFIRGIRAANRYAFTFRKD
jgi:hypothetical protein